jgi:Lanthionine synthetase C-like protein/Protein kinase domain
MSEQMRYHYQHALDLQMERLGTAWHVNTRATTAHFGWTHFQPKGAELPEQGWKIHITAAATDATQMINSIIPILEKYNVAFKVPSSLDGVIHLNSGLGGETQVGKVLTVYPSDPDNLGALAQELDQCWNTVLGPMIPSDLRLHGNSSIFLRYGVIAGTGHVLKANGQRLSAIRNHLGELVPDERRIAWTPPPWLDLPIPDLVRVMSVDPNATIQVSGGEYLPITSLQSTAKGSVQLAIDLERLEKVLVKTARRGVRGDLAGCDATTLLENETRALRALYAQGLAVPKIIEFERKSDETILVMEYLEARPLINLTQEERLLGIKQLNHFLSQLHQRGWVHRDLKPTNVIGCGDDFRVIDFELAFHHLDSNALMGETLNYRSPEQDGNSPQPSADIYSLGVCLASVYLRSDPSQLPLGSGRLVRLMHQVRQPEAARVVARLTQRNPAARPDALSSVVLLDALGTTPAPEGALTRPRELRRFAVRAAHRAAQTARSFSVPQPDGLAWRNQHIMATEFAQGINLGAAGILIGLQSIDHALVRQDHDGVIAQTARWLAAQVPYGEAPGLYTGDAGVAVALHVADPLNALGLRAATWQRLDSAVRHVQAAELFSGAAGVVQAGLMLGQDALDRIEVTVRTLIAGVCNTNGFPTWMDEHAHPNVQFGASHGSSGVALALWQWSEAVGDRQAETLAVETLEAVYRLGRTADETQLRHHLEGGRTPNHTWCHGVAGYLWVLAQLKPLPHSLRDAFEWALQRFLEAPTLSSPTYCHGLAGQLELCAMLDGHAKHRTELRRKVGVLVETLRSLQITDHEGLRWNAEHPQTITPDLWVGFLGPATALARWATGHTGALLSPGWINELQKRHS